MENNEWNQEVPAEQAPSIKKQYFKVGKFLKIATTVCASVALCAVVFAAGTYYGRSSVIKHVEDEFQVGNLSTMQKVESIIQLLDKAEIMEYDLEKLENGLYRGLLDATEDKYAEYYTSEELESFFDDYNGTYSGIGATLMMDTATELISIVQVFEDSPAKEAGIQSGDLIYMINGKEMQGVSLDEQVKLIKGEEGTRVHLTIIRDGKEVEKDVERRSIETPTVTSRMLEESTTGYIVISEFSESTISQFEKALGELKQSGMERMIVDLRNNTGGSLNAVIQMLDMIVDQGLLVTEKDKSGAEIAFKATQVGKIVDVPIVILTNAYTASASEIFTGVLKDYGLAESVGTKTYGKGVVQNLHYLEDGSAIKLTVAEYYLPNGECIQGEGIEPDYELEFDSELYKKDGTDNQLKKAIEVIQAK